MPDPKEFCAAMDDWAKRLIERGEVDGRFGSAWRTVRSYIDKSCLLDRMLYGGEKPSETPCPVHKGRWSGIHLGWPGQKWNDGSLVDESPMLRGWYDAGCRCFQHSCGCTTGRQPEAAAVAPSTPLEPGNG